MPLTDTTVRQASPTNKARKLFDGGGLFLHVSPQGGKWWRLKYRFDGKAKLISLGTYPYVSLKQARERRDAARKQIADGIDPSAERKARKAKLLLSSTGTFEAVAREWLDKSRPKFVETHAEAVIHRLETDVFPWIGGRLISEIDAPELLALLRRIEGRGAVSTAHRMKQTIGQINRYAIATGRASRDSTADLRGALTAERELHLAALTKPDDVAGLMRAIASYHGSFVVRCALRFTALTFGRPGEVRKAEWREIESDNRLWRVPAKKMKMQREHLVPLSRQTLEVLRELHPLTGNGPFLFPGRTVARCISENAITAALRRMGYQAGEMTAHGFRTTASTLLNEQGWSADAIERQLAHVERDKVRGAYNRAEYLDERRRMMQAWADYLDKLTHPAEVVALRPALLA